MPRSPGDPFEPGTRVWFRENPAAYTFARANDLLRGVTREHMVHEGRSLTFVDFGSVARWVPTEHLRSSPPRWLTGKALPQREAKPPVRKEAIVEGEELTIFDALEA